MAARKRKILKRFPKQMQKKLVVVFFLIMIFLIGLTVRITYIHQTSGSKYEKIVLNQRGYDSETIPYRRGDILDSKGTILATSVDVYNVILDCKLINEDKKYIEPTIAALLKSFGDVAEEELRNILIEYKDRRYYVLRKKLPYEEIQGFMEQKNDTKNNPNIIGVWFEKEYVREYSFDSLACKVLGFTTSGNVGIGGLEDYYNDSLNGINGRKFGYLNSDNNFEKTIKDAVNGNSLITTLDMNVQGIVEEKITEFNEAHRNENVAGPGSKNTGVLVMNVKNGEIIAMADSTSYDLNNPWDLSAYYTEEDITGMDEDKTLDALNRIWQNFCITDTFEPGSTIKPLTVSTGLDAGKLKGNEWYNCTGSKVVVEGEKPIRCANGVVHGQVNLEKAIAESCNSALMDMAFTIGIDTFSAYQGIFNMGVKTNIDLPGEARTDTLIHTVEDMKKSKTTLPTNAFGQNFNTTMIQVASAFSSIINGGNYYQPHVVKRIIDENGNTIKNFEPILLKQTISKKVSELVKGYLYKTVAEGTGLPAKVPGYSMGGKTGTAQTYPRGNGKYVVSFIGYAPADNPEILIYVVIDEPNVEDQAHSSYASELTKAILEEILPYLNIFPDEAVIEEPGNGGEENVSPQTGQDGEQKEGREAENALEDGESTTEGQEDALEGEEGTPEGQEDTLEGGESTPESPEGGEGNPEGQEDTQEGEESDHDAGQEGWDSMNIPEGLPPDANNGDNSSE